MPETSAMVTGVASGVALETISFFASILVPMDLPPYAFQVLEIKHSGLARPRPRPAPGYPAEAAARPTLLERIRGALGGGRLGADVEAPSPDGKSPAAVSTGSPSASFPDIEGSGIYRGVRRQNTLKEKVANTLVSGGPSKRPGIPAQLTSPLHILTLLSCLNSLAILACSIVWRDGTAILSISLISLASSIVGYATWWEPRLMFVEGPSNRKLPDGDIMIRTREGAFIYIKCKESVARELFSGTEECKYKVTGGGHNLFMAAGTVILMLAVVLMGNCKWNSQMFIGASYVVLNGLYWALGMLPKRYFWDLSRYDIQDITPDDAKDAHKRTKNPDAPPVDRSFSTRMNTKLSRMGSTIAHPLNPRPAPFNPQLPVDPDSRACFTRTLWYAIRESRSSEWVTKNKAAPHTPVWVQWLAEAEAAARRGERGWRAVERKDVLIERAEAEKERVREAEAAAMEREREKERGKERGREATIPEQER